VFFEKWLRQHLRGEEQQGVPSTEKSGRNWGALANEWLLQGKPPAHPAGFYGRLILYLFFVGWGWQFLLMDYAKLEGGLPEINGSFMHSVNLVFHEAGHVIFLPFGQFITYLGGSIGQLLIPFLVLCYFVFKSRDPFGASLGLWWLAQSGMDISPYLHDARAGQLLLLGGGTGRDRPETHDWHNILSGLGWLEYDHLLAAIVQKISVGLMLLAFVWGAAVLFLQYQKRERWH
jgi:hypothetical protein